MFIWDKIRGAKQAANQHQQRTNAQQEQQCTTTEQAYRHIPTHARQDAMHAMPAADMEDTRRRIREQHQRRSALGLNAELFRSSGRTHPLRFQHIAPPSDVDHSHEAGPSGTYQAPLCSAPSSTSSATPSSIPPETSLGEVGASCEFSNSSSKDLVSGASGLVKTKPQQPALSQDPGCSPTLPSRAAPSGPPTESSLDTSSDSTEPSVPDTVDSSDTSMSSQAQFNESKAGLKASKSPRQQELYEMLVDKQSGGLQSSLAHAKPSLSIEDTDSEARAETVETN